MRGSGKEWVRITEERSKKHKYTNSVLCTNVLRYGDFIVSVLRNMFNMGQSKNSDPRHSLDTQEGRK